MEIAVKKNPDPINMVYKDLNRFISGIRPDSIPEGRKQVLQPLLDYIQEKQRERSMVRLNFICTHNSRRSVMAQIWTVIAAEHFGIRDVIESYSGGTEATAVNPRVISMLKGYGFRVKSGEGENPTYTVHLGEGIEPVICYSKVFSAEENPTTNFAAIMTCSSADKDCPFVPGATARISLNFEDPKNSDGTPEEAATYRERFEEIGSEILYAFNNAVHA